MTGEIDPSTRTSDGSGFVSVVLNFLNAERFLVEAIDSVFAQSYHSWELLLVDDGSTDGGTEIAKRCAQEHSERAFYLEHPGHENRGASAARNFGMAKARGEFVAFLDADDVWLPEHLARGVALLRANPSAAMIYGESQYWHSWAPGVSAADDRVQPQGFRADRVVPAPELLIMHLLHRAALPAGSGITVRREAALGCGGWVESFRGMHDDQAFLARICLRHDVFVSHECLERYRQHEGSLCATAERRGDVAQARRAYLAWLRAFLAEQGMVGTRVWEALRYAERVQEYERPGWYARLARSVLGVAARARIAVRAHTQPRAALRRPA